MRRFHGRQPLAHALALVVIAAAQVSAQAATQVSAATRMLEALGRGYVRAFLLSGAVDPGKR